MLTTKLSKLSPGLMEDFLELGKELGMEVTTDVPIKFFKLEDIKDAKTRKRAEKLLAKAAEEIGALAAMRLHAVEVQARSAERTERTRRPIPPLGIDIVSKRAIGVEESRAILLEGNRRFVSELKRLGIKPGKVKEYDAIIIACSDARCEITNLEDYRDNILVLQVAGNVAAEEVKAALAKLGYGGEVIVCGHLDCGACKAKKSSPEASEGLLGRVNIERKGSDIFAANALNQADEIKKLHEAREKKITVTATVLDHDLAHRGEALSVVGEDPMGTPLTFQLRSSCARRLSESRRAGKDLSTQQAHVIVVSDPLDTGRISNARIFFGAGQNEVFAVSAVNGKLSTEAIGSIDYALSHVEGVEDSKHLVIVHSSMEIARELETVMRKHLGSKGIHITIMQYDPETGEAKLQ